ncbi:MAG TPA: hypothetical protein VFE38_06110 [Edaphobacter sp.]|nr:hypothetical protein [Edaphobacter sp.]
MVGDFNVFSSRLGARTIYACGRPRSGASLIAEDELIALLQQAAESELDGLVACLVERGGITCQLKRLSTYKSNYPHHRVYVNDIAAELQKFGANTLASTFRSGRGVLYEEIVRDVAKRLGVRREGSTAEVEKRITQKLAEKYWEGATPEQRAALLKQVGIRDVALVALPALPAAVISAIHLSGFAAYQLTVIVANAVAHALLGHGLSFAVNAGLTKGVSVFAGPPGWCLVGFLTAQSIASEAYRVTIPAVAQVAMIRSAIEARREREFNRSQKWFHSDVKCAIFAFLACAAIVGAILALAR